MNERIIRLRKDSARISRRTFFNSAGVAGAGLVAACALPSSAHADNDKDNDDDDKGKGKGKSKGKGNDKDRGNECSESVGPSSVCEMPDPIPHVFTNPFGNFHFFFPAPVEGTDAPNTDPTGAHANGRDPSVIYNFRGLVGQADLNLTGAGTNLSNGATAPYAFHTDMRFMKGEFVGTDGSTRRGAFAFI